LRRGSNFPLLWLLFFTLGFCNPLQQKQFSFFVQIWMFMTSMFFQSAYTLVLIIAHLPFMFSLSIKGLQLIRVTNKTMHHLWVTDVH
jgi:hypothetical protein